MKMMYFLPSPLQVRFPIPVRDITKILSTDAFEEVNTLQRIDSHSSGMWHICTQMFFLLSIVHSLRSRCFYKL